MGMSPTARSLAYLRKNGGIAEVVERYNSFSRTRKDLFGWCDIVCLRAIGSSYQLQFIQTTTKSNMSSRITKITDSDTVGPVRKAGVEIFVHGWYKDKRGRWQVEVEDLS